MNLTPDVGTFLHSYTQPEPLGWERGDPAELFGIAQMPALDWLLALRPEWMTRAECARPEHQHVSFWPRHGESAVAAKAICSTCAVLDQCREWALSDPDPTAGHGVAGGLTAGARRGIRAGRKAVHPPTEGPTPRASS